MAGLKDSKLWSRAINWMISGIKIKQGTQEKGVFRRKAIKGALP